MFALPKFVRVMTALVFTTAMAQATAQTEFPNKPITLLVGSAPGGSNDVFARVIGKQLQDVLGVSVVVENKPAAGGILANVLLAKAPADGYTLVVLSSTFTTGAAVRKNLQYDAIKSFTPIAMLAKGPMLITVGNNTSYKTLEDLVKFAKANPGKLNYGTSGVGSINQFASELLSEAADIKMTHEPYKGMGPAVTDLLSGHIDMIIGSAPSLLSQVKAEKIRALAISSVERSEVTPDIRGLKEAGLPKAAVDLWWGMLAPAGTPKPVVDKLNKAINQSITSDAMNSFFVKEGAIPFAMSPDAFASHLATELERWKVIAQNANIQAE